MHPDGAGVPGKSGWRTAETEDVVSSREVCGGERARGHGPAQLREIGVRIAIDDFDTGYSSLAYLTQLPLDVLKVDKSFVDRVTIDKQVASVTEAIIAMSRAMALSTVAEGVEDQGQAAWLRGVQCTHGQGFLWSKPVPLVDARILLAAPAPRTGLSVVPDLAEDSSVA